MAVGSWRHTGTFEQFDGVARRGTAGWYGILEQRLFQQAGDGSRALDLFAQVGAADPGLAEVERHVSLGLAATGGLPGRTGDTMGLMVTSVRMSASCPTAAGARRETAFEVYYGARLGPWLEVKPDLQYVVDPGARGGSNAFAGTVRVTVSF